ncbi:MAG: phenylalanine 4-monooxygenase [Chitinophagales bacterium]
MYNLQQEYNKYTEEDFHVWKLLYERQFKIYPNRAAYTFLKGLKKVNFVADKIPDFDETNAVLKETTGWQLEVVPGLIPDKDFFELLSIKKFPATTWLRKMEELDYLEEPDMFHDVFAHVPILTNQFFVDYLQSLSKIALKHINNPFAIELIGRIYWFTVEFGLVDGKRGLRIYGAGILSSKGETLFCLEDKAVRHPYNVKAIMENHYYKHAFQDRYYMIESYAQLFGSIEEIEYWLDVALKKYPSVSGDVTKLDIVLD